jgi:hypothetical protein
MYLGLSIENSVINAAILNNGGDFVWQDSHSLKHDKISNLLEICGAIVANAAKAHPNLSRLARKVALSANRALLTASSVLLAQI